MAASAGTDRLQRFETALASLVFRDGSERFQLCEPDLAVARFVGRAVTSPVPETAQRLYRLEVPRGANDLSVTVAILAYVIRLLYSEFRGSLVVIGTD